MFYLVGLKTHDGDDWIYEISQNKVVNEFCADNNDYPRNVFAAYGAEIGGKIKDCIENLDYRSLKQKRKVKIMEIINSYRKKNNYYRIGKEYRVFKIPIEAQHCDCNHIKETSTLC